MEDRYSTKGFPNTDLLHLARLCPLLGPADRLKSSVVINTFNQTTYRHMRVMYLFTTINQLSKPNRLFFPFLFPSAGTATAPSSAASSLKLPPLPSTALVTTPPAIALATPSVIPSARKPGLISVRLPVLALLPGLLSAVVVVVLVMEEVRGLGSWCWLWRVWALGCWGWVDEGVDGMEADVVGELVDEMLLVVVVASLVRVGIGVGVGVVGDKGWLEGQCDDDSEGRACLCCSCVGEYERVEGEKGC